MPSADEIIAKVDRKEEDTQKLRQRMDEDYRKRWLLEEYEGNELGYSSYTSNESQTDARKIVSMLSGSAMTTQVPQGNDDRDTRDEDNDKERFVIGNFRANDERLGLVGLPTLRQSMSFTLPIFGYTCGRASLIKEDGISWADATPWDPKEVMWEFGHKGLLWICHKYYRLRVQVEDEWRVKSELTFGEGGPYDAVAVYDYYDVDRNYVLSPALRERPLKNRLHGLRDRVPGWVVASSLQPPVIKGFTDGSEISSLELQDSLADYGESIFAANRALYNEHNYSMSIYKELTKRSLKPVFGIKSADGVKVVEEDPFIAGTEIPLAEGEDLVVYDFIKAQQDMIPYMTVISRETQKGGLPSIMHGEAPGNISGYAMNTLRAGVSDKVLPLAQAESIALRQIANIWCDQFDKGGFGSMDLSGQGRNRKWFSGLISPEQIRDKPAVDIKLAPQLPEDNAGKVNIAQMLRQPSPVNGMPLKSDYRIREEDLQMEDSDLEYDAILQEMAGRDPLVMAHRMTDSLAKRGDEAAQYWHAKWMMLVIQMKQAGIPLGELQPPDTENDTGYSVNSGGFDPSFMPRQVQGLPSPTPTPQQGPLVAPGTPRPGAQNRNGNNSGFNPFSRS